MSKCETCSAHIPKHSYEWELLFKHLYPNDYKTTHIVCEKCAIREVGKNIGILWKEGENDI